MPLIPFGRAAEGQGHQVLLVVPRSAAAVARESGLAHLFGDDPPREEVEPIWEEFAGAEPGRRAELIDGELFGRHQTEALLREMERIWMDWAPELVLREPCEYASAVMAERSGTLQAQVAISLARVEHAALGLAGPRIRRHTEGLAVAIAGSPYLSRFPPSLDPSKYPDTRRYREALEPAPPRLPGWWEDDRLPLVYLTLGTTVPRQPVARSLFATLIEAVAGLPVRALLTVGRGGPREGWGRLPSNLRLEEWVDQEAALAAADLVVCHGGSGTTLGALARGLPLVVTPIFADQLVNGAATAARGAAVSLPPAPGGGSGQPPWGGAEEVRAAIVRGLDDHSLREAARELGAEMGSQPQPGELLSSLAPA